MIAGYDFLSELIRKHANTKKQMMSILDHNGYIVGLKKKKMD